MFHFNIIPLDVSRVILIEKRDIDFIRDIYLDFMQNCEISMR